MLVAFSRRPHLFPDPNAVSRNPPFLSTTPLGAIAGLVDVFRQVARMGPATVTGVTIKAGSAAPWVLAFAQWCVEPPSVFLVDRSVVERPGSRIRVVLSNDINQPIEVTIHHQVKELTSLLLGPATFSKAATGMVTVELYRAWLLLELGFDDGALRLLRESLQCAIPRVLRKMTDSRFARLGQDASSGRRRDRTDKTGTRYPCCPSPLPDIQAIAATCTTFLALKDPIKLTISDDITPIAELPLVARHLASLEHNCHCEHCLGSSDVEWCKKEQFFRSLAFIIMDILALSLFDSISTLLVRLSIDRGNWMQMEIVISELIETGSSGDFDGSFLIAWADSYIRGKCTRHAEFARAGSCHRSAVPQSRPE